MSVSGIYIDEKNYHVPVYTAENTMYRLTWEEKGLEFRCKLYYDNAFPTQRSLYCIEGEKYDVRSEFRAQADFVFIWDIGDMVVGDAKWLETFREVVDRWLKTKDAKS